MASNQSRSYNHGVSICKVMVRTQDEPTQMEVMEYIVLGHFCGYRAVLNGSHRKSFAAANRTVDAYEDAYIDACIYATTYNFG